MRRSAARPDRSRRGRRCPGWRARPFTGCCSRSGRKLLNDPDSFSHIAVGRWIVAHGTVPTSDPFSFSMHGAHWIAFEWLSELSYAGAFWLAGWPGVVVLAAGAIALAFALLARFLLRRVAGDAGAAVWCWRRWR